MKQFVKIFILYFFAVVSLFSQVDTLENETQQELQMYLEDAATSGVADLDWNVILEKLRYYRKHPLDLNSASEEELSEIPYFTPYLIAQLKSYIRRNGKLISIWELQAVPGFSKAVFDKIKPYVTVKNVGEYDIKEKKQWIAPPKLRDVFSDGKFIFIQRFGRVLEDKEGYIRQELPDSIKETKSYYLGSPWRVYTRLRFQYKQRVSIAVIGEKDPGELFFQNNISYDFLSAHFFIKDFGRVRRFVLGDYTAQFGQGLIFSRGLGFGKTAMTVTGVKAPQAGIRPYTSVNEFSFLRGSALSLDIHKNLQITLLASRKKMDASVSTDTLEDEETTVFYSLQNSGFHRTNTELSRRGQLTENLFGGRMEFNSFNFRLGVNGLYQNFSIPMQAGNKPYQQFNFSGQTNYITSADWDWSVRNVNFFGEMARSKSGGTAFLAGALAGLSSKVDFAISLRNFDKNFHSFYGYAFSERPFALQNERGFYLGTEIRPNYSWTINAFFDKYEFPWYTYNRSAPTDGYEALFQIRRNRSRKQQWYFRIRTETKATDNSETVLKIPEYTTRTYLRWHIKTKPSLSMQMQSRIEISIYKNRVGMMAYKEVFKQLNRYFKLGGRFALFDVPDYQGRIYAFETNMPTTYSIPAFYGKGVRAYLLLRIKPKRNVDIWIRLARTFYVDREEISSGLEKINGNTNTELRMQLRVKF